ncbi:MAG: MBL fold metallo-hydrolase, partial [Pseudomonadota bacterium]
QLAHPEVTYRLDIDPVQAAESRVRLFDMIASEDCLFTATHLTTLNMGCLRRDGTGYRYLPA